MRAIQHWMGHADGKTTPVYAHYQHQGTRRSWSMRPSPSVSRSLP
jgi:integrase